MAEPCLILVKHALPELEPERAPRHWQLGPRGHAGAKRLAAALRQFLPLRLESSSEAKAAQTADVVALELGLMRHERVGLEEIDRPAQPILSRETHVAHNARLFLEPARAVVGAESAERASSRFSAAVAAALSKRTSVEHLVVVTHGTVIALFVAAHHPVDAFALWQRLSCPALVRVSIPDFALLEVQDTL
jgi:broad specificity phosphatase PhoE